MEMVEKDVETGRVYLRKDGNDSFAYIPKYIGRTWLIYSMIPQDELFKRKDPVGLGDELGVQIDKFCQDKVPTAIVLKEVESA
jgi:hypothetical protein